MSGETKQIDLYEVIDFIRPRAEQYLGYNSIRCMQSFIGSMELLDFRGCIDLVSSPPFGGFHEWIRAKYSFGESTSGWCNMILAKTVVWSGFEQVERAALDRFFQDLDEYRKDRSEGVDH